MEIYLSLGSNVGDRGENIQAAMVELENWGVKILRSSSIYETEPVGLKDQPWFYNMILKCETSLTPEEVLKITDSVEKSLKRVRAEKFGPRTMDIDILLFGDRVIDVPGLNIPHKRMHERRFILVPLVEIASDAYHPTLKKTSVELLKECSDRAIVSKL